jgi:hypothetical protein
MMTAVATHATPKLAPIQASRLDLSNERSVRPIIAMLVRPRIENCVSNAAPRPGNIAIHGNGAVMLDAPKTLNVPDMYQKIKKGQQHTKGAKNQRRLPWNGDSK